MKTYFKTTFLVMLFAISANAQSGDYKFVAGFHAGYSLTGSFIKGIVELDNGNVTSSVIPALQVTADYALTNNFSIGVAVSHQSVKIDASDYYYYDFDANMGVTESFTASFRRSQIALRPLFHYGSDKADMYSGLRVGILRRGFTNFSGIESGDRTDDEFSDIVFDGTDGSGLHGTRFSLGITAFGFRYFFTDNIGFGGELNLGAPYIVNAGLSIRL